MSAFPGPSTFPDHGSGVRAAVRQPLTLQAETTAVLAMTASPVTVGSIGMGAITASHGMYPGTTIYPGIYPGHGSDLTSGSVPARPLAVTPV